MTIEQANSELMQIYGALAPNKQIAIDTLIKASIKSQERDSTTKASITMMRLDYIARLKADMVEMLDTVRADIIIYEADCRLSVDEYPSCKQCTDNVFESIYEILDKYKTELEMEDRT